MLIDRGKRGLCLGLVLTYPEAIPQGGLDGRMTRRHYCRPTLPFLTRAMPGETPARVKHRNGYARALRAPNTPQGSPPIDPRALVVKGRP